VLTASRFDEAGLRSKALAPCERSREPEFRQTPAWRGFSSWLSEDLLRRFSQGSNGGELSLGVPMTWVRQSILFWLGAAALSLSITVCGNGVNDDEVECEQAVAHLLDCCPNFSADSVNCVNTTNDGPGCLSFLVSVNDDVGPPPGREGQPDLTISESVCIEDMACADVRSSGLCEQIAAQVSDAGTGPSGLGGPPVCP
jgi:hypothetical protein